MILVTGMSQGLKIWGGGELLHITWGPTICGASSKGGAKIWGGVRPPSPPRPCLPSSDMPELNLRFLPTTYLSSKIKNQITFSCMSF